MLIETAHTPIEPGDWVARRSYNPGYLSNAATKVFKAKSSDTHDLMINKYHCDREEAESLYVKLPLSPAMMFIDHFRRWSRNNKVSLHEIVIQAVESNMKFFKDDFKLLRDIYRFDCSCDEYFYKKVIVSSNRTAATSLKRIFNRPAMWLPRKEEVLLDTDFRWMGLAVCVTSFKQNDDGEWYAVACNRSYHNGEWTINRIFRITQADLDDRTKDFERLRDLNKKVPQVKGYEVLSHSIGDNKAVCSKCQKKYKYNFNLNGNKIDLLVLHCEKCGVKLRTFPSRETAMATLEAMESGHTPDALPESIRVIQLLCDDHELSKRVIKVMERYA